MEPKKLPLLKISDDKRYLVGEAGRTPFFWLGDTAWELLHRLNIEEVKSYFEDRSKKGFTVIQTVILAELDGLQTPNANGEIPLHDQDPDSPNEKYFSYVDKVLEEAARLGLYVALLPTWGDKYQKAWGVGPEIFTPENARKYGAYLGKRYGSFSNIIWVLGGDRVPKNKTEYQINEKLAKGIKEAGAVQLITVHPKGGNIASDIFGKETWLDIDMFQSKHLKGCLEYKFTQRAMRNLPVRPVIDGEPGYENIPNYLNKWGKDRLDAYDVRRSAYWNMLSGAAGHTYGCNEIWQMYSPGRSPLHGAHLTWTEAMSLPGAFQMGIMRRLFEQFPWQRLRAIKGFVRGINWRNSAHTVGMVDVEGQFALAYSPSRKRVRLDLSLLKSQHLSGYFLDPEKEITYPIPSKLYPKKTTFKFPRVPDTEKTSKDWLIVLLDETFGSGLRES
ncbi:apiosidase-like domain-containing protein [Pleomorphovibrio marinus]|uniref:apiosidase-like domain-containing protein n=1 Tax=Pleomorphovibrio marinus TaxID=2164132 RepID=UPI000E0BD915|nr:DUF4038 domain-containing protein [Pleomorphovibrio marinus]